MALHGYQICANLRLSSSCGGCSLNAGVFPPEGVRGASARTLELDHISMARDLPASSTIQKHSLS